jgi:hypothetical protein
MPTLSFFADGRDVNLLVDRLNADPEIAFLVPDGPLDPEVAFLNRLRAAMGERTEGTFYLPFGAPDDGYRQRWKAAASGALGGASTVTSSQEGDRKSAGTEETSTGRVGSCASVMACSPLPSNNHESRPRGDVAGRSRWPYLARHGPQEDPVASAVHPLAPAAGGAIL